MSVSDVTEAVSRALQDLGFGTRVQRLASGVVWVGFGAPGSLMVHLREREGRAELQLAVDQVGRTELLDAVAQEINRSVYCLKAVVIRDQGSLSLRAVTGSRPLWWRSGCDAVALGVHVESFVDELRTIAPLLAKLEPGDAFQLARPRIQQRPRPVDVGAVASRLEPLLGPARRAPMRLDFEKDRVRRHALLIEGHDGNIEHVTLLAQRAMAPADWGHDENARLNGLNLHSPAVATFVTADHAGLFFRTQVPLGAPERALDAIEEAAETLLEVEEDDDVLASFEAYGVE